MIEATLVSLAAPILAGGLHPHVAPNGVAKPYGTYLIVSDIAETCLDGGDLISNAIVQIDIWSVTYATSKTAADAFVAAIAAADLTSHKLRRRTRYEPDTQLHGVIIEYSFWYH